jgi:hypothetical protein
VSISAVSYKKELNHDIENSFSLVFSARVQFGVKMSSIFNSRKIFYKELLVLLLLLLLLLCPSKSQPIAVDGDKVSNIKVELATDG